jgi:hypothetical protein
MRWTTGVILFGFITLVFGAWIGTVYEYGGENPVGSGVLVWTRCTCHGNYAYDYANASGLYGLDLSSGMTEGCHYLCLTADDGEYTGTAQAHGIYSNTGNKYRNIELGVY